jgi:uncharacterized protein YkwD
VLRLKRHLLASVTAVAVSAVFAPAALAACAGGDVAPTDPGAVAATLCLLNAERTERGLDPLAASGPLDKAADGYAQDMVARRFFDHVSPGGGTMMDRIKAAGWVAAGSWSAGENIAWGSGELGTPAAIVDGWMHSAGHRANILTGSFTQIGIGIAGGAPASDIPGVAGTYVTDFTSGGTAGSASVPAKPKRPAVRCATKASAKAHSTRRGPRRAHAAATRRCAKR